MYTVSTNPSTNSTSAAGFLARQDTHHSMTSLHSLSQFAPQDAYMAAHNHRTNIIRYQHRPGKSRLQTFLRGSCEFWVQQLCFNQNSKTSSHDSNRGTLVPRFLYDYGNWIEKKPGLMGWPARLRLILTAKSVQLPFISTVKWRWAFFNRSNCRWSILLLQLGRPYRC